MKANVLLSAWVSLFILSCKKENVEVSPKPQSSGYFVFSLSQPAARTTNASDDSKDFDLGDVRTSKSFGFYLTNGGGRDITSVKMLTGNASFIISPTNINELKVNQVGLSQTISLDIVHGKAINGSSLSSLLPMNSNIGTLTITGKTTNEKNEFIDISAIAKFKINVLLMDISLLENNKEIRLDTNFGGVSTNLGGLGSMRNYWIKNSKFTIKNTGDVPISLKYGTKNNGTFENQISLEINAEKEFSIDNVMGSLFFEFDGSNTMTNDKRIQLGNNGKGYLNVLRIPEQ